MREWAYEFLVYMLDIGKIWIVGRHLLGISTKQYRKIWFPAITFSGIAALIHNNMYQSKYVLICYLFTLLCVALFMFEERKSRLIVLLLILIIVIASVDTISGFFFGLIQRNRSWDKSQSVNIISSGITLLFCFIIGNIFKKNKIVFPKSMQVRYFLLFLGIVLLNIIFLTYLLEFIWRFQWEGYSSILYGTYIGITLSAYAQIGLILYLAASRNYHKECNELNREYLKAQRQHFDYLRDKEKSTMKVRHDLKNHLYVLKKLVDSSNKKELVSYINQLNKLFHEDASKVNTHNEIVNAIINKYYSDTTKCGANLVIQGHMPSECSIEGFDLCIIFSNLLSNALDAVKSCENKTIKLQIRYDKEQIYILEENDYKEKIVQKENRFITCKKNKENHGWGMQNILESVKKYNGLSNVEYQKNHFKILIALPNQK